MAEAEATEAMLSCTTEVTREPSISRAGTLYLRRIPTRTDALPEGVVGLEAGVKREVGLGASVGDVGTGAMILSPLGFSSSANRVLRSTIALIREGLASRVAVSCRSEARRDSRRLEDEDSLASVLRGELGVSGEASNLRA